MMWLIGELGETKKSKEDSEDSHWTVRTCLHRRPFLSEDYRISELNMLINHSTVHVKNQQTSNLAVSLLPESDFRRVGQIRVSELQTRSL